jgi:hypothetical protein
MSHQKVATKFPTGSVIPISGLAVQPLGGVQRVRTLAAVFLQAIFQPRNQP